MNKNNVNGRPQIGAEYHNKKREPAEVRSISETHVVLFFPERLIDVHQVVLRGDFNGQFSAPLSECSGVIPQ